MAFATNGIGQNGISSSYDAALSNPAEADILSFDAITGKWVNRPAVTGAKGDAGDIAPTNGTSSVTTWNGSTSYDLSAWTVPSTYHRTVTNNITIATLPVPSSAISGTLTLVLRHTTSNSNTFTVTWPATVYVDADQDNAFVSTAGYYTIYHLFWTGLKWALSKQGDFNFSDL
ncbi:MAG: hypothetical protein WAR37_01005 [Candidatus Microsaccharimonas sp.]